VKHEFLEQLFSYIPVLQTDILHDAPSIYVATGTYVPPIEDLARDLTAANEVAGDFDWLSCLDALRGYMQEPETIRDADLDTAGRLLALAATADRFNKSLLPHLCSSGYVLELLLRLRSLTS